MTVEFLHNILLKLGFEYVGRKDDEYSKYHILLTYVKPDGSISITKEMDLYCSDYKDGLVKLASRYGDKYAQITIIINDLRLLMIQGFPVDNIVKKYIGDMYSQNHGLDSLHSLWTEDGYIIS